MKLFMVLSLLVYGNVSVALAQGSDVGGGVIDERTLKNMLYELSQYFEANPEAQSKFPEIKGPGAYDEKHPEESFSKLLYSLNPVLYEGEKRSEFLPDRDCEVHFGNPKNRYFRCNKAAFPNLTNQTAPEIYGFLFHEGLVAAGLEKGHVGVPSTYDISGRMTYHEETYLKVVPGENKLVHVEMVSESGIICTTEKSFFTSYDAQEVIAIKKSGEYVYFETFFPRYQRARGMIQFQAISKWDDIKEESLDSLAILFGRKSRIRVFSRGVLSRDPVLRECSNCNSFRADNLEEARKNPKFREWNLYWQPDLSKTPRFTGGSYTEFLAFLDVRQNRRYLKSENMVCRPLNGWTVGWVDWSKIWSSKAGDMIRFDIIQERRKESR